MASLAGYRSGTQVYIIVSMANLAGYTGDKQVHIDSVAIVGVANLVGYSGTKRNTLSAWTASS